MIFDKFNQLYITIYSIMETLYHQTNKLVQETQHLFTQLERKLPNLDLSAIENDIESKISMINRYFFFQTTNNNCYYNFALILVSPDE